MSASRLLGILGGMSPESTAEYYRQLNRAIGARLGPPHSARVLIHSIDFGELRELQLRDEWDAAGELLAQAAAGLEAAGAEAILMASNTMHRAAARIEEEITVPFLHIVDATGAALRDAKVQRAGLLGTAYTMELPFWRERLESRFGIALVVPDAAQRTDIDRIIFDELCAGEIRQVSRARYVEVIATLAQDGAAAVIFGCTEIGLLLGPSESPLPVFDTTAIHVAAAVEFALGATSAAPSRAGGP